MIKVFAIMNIAILLTFEHRCVIHSNENRTRPSLENFYVSENENFKVHYDMNGNNAPDLTDLNNNSIPDYIEEVGIIAESSMHILVDVMGYMLPPNDGDNFYDIYVVNQSAWGWNVPESPITGASYIKIDNNYLGNTFNSSYCSENIDKMRVSVAHEFFHAIQRAYRPNYNTDHDFLLEMSSMWFEDIMVPECNDYLSFTSYSNGIFKQPEQKFDGSESLNSASFGYSMALFGHYLSTIVDKKGTKDQQKSTIIREIWEDYQNQNNQDGINAAGQSIINVVSNYNIPFSDVWSDFITRNIFSGYFDYFNQEFYYYLDQKYMTPISFNHLSNPISIDDDYDFFYSLDPYSVEILEFDSIEDQLIDLEYTNTDCQISNIAIKGNQNTLFNSDNLDLPLNLNPSDILYLISISNNFDCLNIGFQILSSSVPIDSVILYPNPIYYQGEFFIEIDSYQNIENVVFEIYDISGRRILKQDRAFTENPISINVSEKIKASGVYMLKIFFNEESYTYKFSVIN